MKYLLMAIIVGALTSCNSGETDPAASESRYLKLDNNGVAIPKNFHVQWPLWTLVEDGDKKIKLDQSERILGMLEVEGIKYELVVYDDNQYLVWDEKDNSCVQKVFRNERNNQCEKGI